MKKHYLTAALCAIALNVWANNLTISNISIVDIDIVNKTQSIQFDVSWDNSWRTSTYEANWDAVWLFVKWRFNGTDTWYHATIGATGSTGPSGSEISVPADEKGAFIYRSANGSGTASFTGVKLVWTYDKDAYTPKYDADICVFGIEMVYIPQGAFYLGDGSSSGSSTYSFYTYGTTNTPYKIESENQINMGQGAGRLSTVGGSLNYTTLPAIYPKGYQAFYIMKHELTQGQYRDFLNKLTLRQQNGRVATTTDNYYINNSDIPTYRMGIKRKLNGGNPSTFICDLNNNGTGDEADDGEHIACNYLTRSDLDAYACWAGLRPMSELEYEKACRGTDSPSVNERPWGVVNPILPTDISNPGTSTEMATNNDANVALLNPGVVEAPMRVGCFAKATTTRSQSGATYYGVMNMGDNLSEYVIGVRHTDNYYNFRSDRHGNGVLDINGKTSVDFSSYRMKKGGSIGAATAINISDRTDYANSQGDIRSPSVGGRLVRTAP